MSSLPLPDGIDWGRVHVLPRFTREQVTQWFLYFGVSFRDVNAFCATLFNMRREFYNLDHLPPAEKRLRQQGIVNFVQIVEDIAQHPYHRHREDAKHIIDEVHARESGKPDSLLISDPRGFPYTGSDQLQPPYTPHPGIEPFTPANIQERHPPRLPGDPLPRPYSRRPVDLSQGCLEYPGFEGILTYYIPVDMSSADICRGIIETSISDLSILDPGLIPYKYQDDPCEQVLDMPEDCPFITAPTPAHDPSLLEMETWPLLEIYDYRSRNTKTQVDPGTWIYKLFEWGRMRMAQPDVAKAYCIVFRANSRRWQAGTPDELANEPPPTEEELNTMIAFITKTMPTIYIGPAKTEQKDPLGYHKRSRPTAIVINGWLFDAVEDLYRSQENPATMLYSIFIVFMHECTHYYNSVVYVTPDHHAYTTPRNLRYLVSQGFYTEQNHPSHDPWYIVQGELGEIIEWLIFGGLQEAHPATNHSMVATCWGSHFGNDQIVFGAYVSERLLPAPIRMGNLRWRLFIDMCEQQEANEASESSESSEELAEEISEVDAHRIAEREAAEILAGFATAGMQIAGNGTAQGIISFMSAETGQAAGEMPGGGGGADYGTESDELDLMDTQEDFSGHVIGKNMVYRNAVRRVNAEIHMDPVELFAKRFPYIPVSIKTACGKYRTHNENIIHRHPSTAPLIPRTLPDHIRPWALMLVVSIYVSISMWIFFNSETLYPAWVVKAPRIFRGAHLFATAVVSFFIYIAPLRILLKPLGMVRQARHGYFEWTKSVRSPFDVFSKPSYLDEDWNQQPLSPCVEASDDWGL